MDGVLERLEPNADDELVAFSTSPATEWKWLAELLKDGVRWMWMAFRSS